MLDKRRNSKVTVANGGWNGPFGDMIKYLEFIMGNPLKQPTYDQVLLRSSLEEMFKPRVEVSAEGNRRTAMGLSFSVEDHFGMRFITHGGDQNAFKTRFYLNYQSKVAYVVAYNTFVGISEMKNTSVLDEEIRGFIFRRVFPQILSN